jgi:hypothetical protein
LPVKSNQFFAIISAFAFFVIPAYFFVIPEGNLRLPLPVLTLGSKTLSSKLIKTRVV